MKEGIVMPTAAALASAPEELFQAPVVGLRPLPE